MRKQFNSKQHRAGNTKADQEQDKLTLTPEWIKDSFSNHQGTIGRKQKRPRWTGLREFFIWCFVFSATVSGSLSYAEISFYVDPDWGGTTTGSANTPWIRCDQTAQWNTINSALISDNVTIYFSAREAQSDVDETSNYTIKILRTEVPPNFVTFDGKSKWNRNDSNPTWQNYGGSSRFQINSSDAAVFTNNNIFPFPHRRRFTVRGFRFIGDKVLSINNASEVLIEDNDISSHLNARRGPCIHIDVWQATNNGTLWSDGITIRNNYVHDTYGEGIYVNGHKTNPSVANPSSNNILIEGNTFSRAGIYGAEGDGIDCKDGVRNLVVRGNIVHDSSFIGISTVSGGIFDSNFIYGSGTLGIRMGIREGSYPNKDGTKVINNIIVANAKSPVYIHGPGIQPDWTNVLIANNVFALNGSGLQINPGDDGINPTVYLYNNIFWKNGGDELFLQKESHLLEHRNNIYGDVSTNFNLVRIRKPSPSIYSIDNLVQNFESTAFTENPRFMKETLPYVDTNFRLRSTSPALGTGTFIGDVTQDYLGNPRLPTNSDMGAFQISSDAEQPNPPQGLRIVQ